MSRSYDEIMLALGKMEEDDEEEEEEEEEAMKDEAKKRVVKLEISLKPKRSKLLERAGV